MQQRHIMNLPRPRWRGFSFALHPTRCRAFIFARMQYSPIQAFTACFAVSMQLYRPRRKTAHRVLQGLFLRLHPFNHLQYQTDKSGYNTICDALEGVTAPEAPPAHTRYHRHAETLDRPAQAAYYNKVYKRMQHIADHASGGGVGAYRVRIAGKC